MKKALLPIQIGSSAYILFNLTVIVFTTLLHLIKITSQHFTNFHFV